MTKHRPAQGAARKPLTRTKVRIFTLLTLLFPILFFVLLEGTLRLLRYGPDLSLFKTDVIAGRPLRVMNPEVKNRYFSSVRFSPNTSLDYFEDPKPERTYRIFCLGGSTTVGFPYGYAGSFAAYLRDRLRGTFPGRRIEVINLGMTATNSYTVNDIAADLFSHRPDLLIVYDGHNEFYGALGTSSAEAHGSARWMTLAYLRLIHFRTFLLLKTVTSAIGQHFAPAGGSGDAGTMMERLARGRYVAYGSSEYSACLGNFRANLDDLVRLCGEHRVPVILSTQVSNLRDRPPFVPGEERQLSPPEAVQFNALFNEGLRYLMEDLPDSALAAFLRASEIDSLRSGVQYQIGVSLDRLGRASEAERKYVLSRDLDMLRFRASSDFNNAILAAGARGGAVVVDLEWSFRRASPDSLIGSSLILEHLHPNQRGYFLMAKEYAAAMRRCGMIAGDSEWARADTLSDDSLWNARGLTEIDERAASRRIDILTSSWPFQPGDSAPGSVAPGDPIAVIAERFVRAELSWEEAHVAAAEYHERRGNLDKARAEYRALIRTLPVNVSAYLRLARTYLRTGQLDLAEEILTNSLAVEPTSFANRTLASIAIDEGRPAEALPYLERAAPYATGPEDRSHIALLQAIAYQRLGKREQALRYVDEALRAKPDNATARTLLRRLGGQ